MINFVTYLALLLFPACVTFLAGLASGSVRTASSIGALAVMSVTAIATVLSVGTTDSGVVVGILGGVMMAAAAGVLTLLTVAVVVVAVPRRDQEHRQ